MGREIERRFLVKEGFHPWDLTDNKVLINQTYLMGTGDWAVRCRASVPVGSEAMAYEITFKQGITKLETKEITVPTTYEGYADFISECRRPISKTRYHIPHGDLVFEVDCFHNDLFVDLIIAEIELPTVDTQFVFPDWLGEEITGRKGTSNFAMWRQMHGIKKKG